MRVANAPGIWLSWSFCLLLLGAMQAVAEEEPELVQYIEMQPSFVLNYGGPSPKLTYAKVDISLRVNTRAAAAAVEHHMPKLRNIIVLLFSQQDEAVMGNQPGREELRQKALATLQEFFNAEEGAPTVADLLFTNFVVQR